MESNYPYTEKEYTRPSSNEKRDQEERRKIREQKIALVDKFLVMNQNDLPQAQIPMLRQNMLHCSMRKLYAIQQMSLRRAYNMQFISIILGWSGIDRMLIGDMSLGLIKLLTLGGFGLIMIYDWLVIVHHTRRYNYLQVMSVLDYNDYEAPGQG